MANFNVDARAGFMPFDLTELHDLWGSLQDGNYWSAFRRAINILDNMVNPTLGRTTPRPWEPKTGERIDECCEKLQEWCDTGPQNQPARRTAGEPNLSAIDPASIVTIVTLILKFVSEWRKRRNPDPANLTGATNEKFTGPSAGKPDPSNRIPAPKFDRTPLANTANRNPDGSINRPVGMTSDQPAPAATNPDDPSGETIPVSNDTNTKADTLAGRQTQFPPDMERATNERDVDTQVESDPAPQEANANEAGPNREPNQGGHSQSDAMRQARETQAKTDAARAAEASKPKPGQKPGGGGRK